MKKGKKLSIILSRGLNGLFLTFMIVALATMIAFSHYTKSCERRIASLEESMVTLQKTVIRHDEIIFKSLALLYDVAQMPTEEKLILEKTIEGRKKLWQVNSGE